MHLLKMKNSQQLENASMESHGINQCLNSAFHDWIADTHGVKNRHPEETPSAKMLSLAREGHLGIVGTNQKLRSRVWWPGIEKDPVKYCKTSYGCKLVSRPSHPENIRNGIMDRSSQRQNSQNTWKSRASDTIELQRSGFRQLAKWSVKTVCC